jgi:hypothetical protein
MLEMSNLEFNLLTNMLKESPDGMFVCDRYIAFWQEAHGKVYLIPGNYLHLNEEEANQVLQTALKKALKI